MKFNVGRMLLQPVAGCYVDVGQPAGAVGEEKYSVVAAEDLWMCTGTFSY